MAKKKATLIAVREKIKKPKAVTLGIDFAEAHVDKTRLRGERRFVFLQMSGNDSEAVRKFAEFCKQAADWMDDDK
jgi:hypothetical protein